MARAYWLIKSEPGTFSVDDLAAWPNRTEHWDGVRNYQARNFLRAMKRGDRAIFYHSNAKPPGVAGIAKIVKGAEPDPTQFDPGSKYHDPKSNPDDPRWDWVTVAPDRELEFLPRGEEIDDMIRAGPRIQSLPAPANGSRARPPPRHRPAWRATSAATHRLAGRWSRASHGGGRNPGHGPG